LFASLSKLNKLSLKTPRDYSKTMKLTIPAIGVLSTIVLLVSIGVMYENSYETSLSNLSAGPSGAAYMTGNVKVTHFDKDGQVIGYRQGTNHITATGMSVIMGQVFAGMNVSATQRDTGNLSGTVAWMEIGTGGDTDSPVGPPWTTNRDYVNALRWNDTDIIEPVLTGTAGLNPLCIRIHSGITNATQLEAHTSPNDCQSGAGGQSSTGCAAQMNVTATAQFQGTVCSVNGIDEAGIFTHEDGSEGQMFARNNFGSVNLGPLDTLQLEWEFTFKDSI